MLPELGRETRILDKHSQRIMDIEVREFIIRI
jgi:hypothetical protein